MNRMTNTTRFNIVVLIVIEMGVYSLQLKNVQIEYDKALLMYR